MKLNKKGGGGRTRVAGVRGNESTPVRRRSKRPGGHSLALPGLLAREPASDGELPFEETLWAAADKLRMDVDAAQYKHIVLGLLFLKWASHDGTRAATHDFKVPATARWPAVVEAVQKDEPGRALDKAVKAIEEANPVLRDALARDYARSGIEPSRMRALVNLFDRVAVSGRHDHARDVLGRVYEYFLAQFASAEGTRGGQFYTPRSVVGLLVDLLAPFRGIVYDPCCGSGGMFVQSEDFLRAHGGSRDDLRVFGQESNLTTWRLARMNLALHGIEANLGPKNADTFLEDLHSALRADYILANPPFNASDWGAERLGGDPRWTYGVPSSSNANFAWVQHMLHHLTPDGVAGFVLANGSMTANNGSEGTIRRRLIEADLVDCIVALPAQLFYSTQIPVCIWVLARNKKGKDRRDRRGETLFIDARSLGHQVDRTRQELTTGERSRIAAAYRGWCGDRGAASYVDVPGFCRSATLADIQSHRYALAPGRYVGFSPSVQQGWDALSLRRELQGMEALAGEVGRACKNAVDVMERVLNG